MNSMPPLEIVFLWLAILSSLWSMHPINKQLQHVECRGGVGCLFPDLYYDTSTQTFFVPAHADVPADTRLFDTCTLEDHSSCHFKVEKRSSWREPNTRFDGVHLVRRFYSYNIFHMLHDDWLGAWDLHHHYWPELPLRGGIVAIDHYAYERHDVMWNWLHGKFTLIPSNQNAGRIIRLSNVLVGSSKRLSWYQYGFGSVQGPIRGKDVNVESIHAAVEHVQSKLGKGDFEVNTKVAVMLQRRANRVIRNEEQVMEALGRLGYEARVMSLEENAIEELIRTISSASVLVGAHGSLFALGLFLPPTALLVEVFPWRVDPLQVTPFRTMQTIRGRRYAALNTTKAHSFAPKNQDMLKGLPERHLRRILRPTTPLLQMKRCCTDPEWLFYVNHDCLIDCVAMEALLTDIN